MASLTDCQFTPLARAVLLHHRQVLPGCPFGHPILIQRQLAQRQALQQHRQVRVALRQHRPGDGYCSLQQRLRDGSVTLRQVGLGQVHEGGTRAGEEGDRRASLVESSEASTAVASECLQRRSSVGVS